MAPETPRQPSSRLLTMKFMQRAAASASSTGSPDSETHSSKKRKLGHSPADGRLSLNIDQAAIQAALDDQEAKRQAALEKHGVGADTHWVLKASTISRTKPTKAPMNIVYVGYGDIDSSDESGENEDAAAKGRTSTADYKKKPKTAEPRDGSDASSGSSDTDSDDSDDSDGSRRGKKRKPSSDSPNSRSDRGRSRSQSMSRRKSVESAKAKEFRDKRKKKEVRLNKLTSISSAGDPQLGARSSQDGKAANTCYKCHRPGHKAVDCPKSRGRTQR